MDGLDAMLENGPLFIRNNPFILKKWNLDVKLLKEDVGNVLVWVKLHGVPLMTFSEDGLSVIAIKLGTPLMLTLIHLTCACNHEVFDHILKKCPKNIVSDVDKNLKNPRQVARGIQVGTKVAFKPLKQVYRPVSDRNNASSSGKKKQAIVASKEVSLSKPFDMLNSVEKDDDLARSFKSGSNTSTTPITERIDKIERQMIDEKITLVDDDGKPLPKVISKENVDSNSEVEEVVDDHAVFMASTDLKRGADNEYGTNSLLEQ
ncbi:ARID DNA-binding domain-containing protein [Tanacetum coccineum]|uniref:ARID DNA-binding domain-containing protein n=1 Tax=Tanacetum coccineum TaxID=301880 RepID=A0ABQ5GT18_9ASTR